MHPLRYLPLVGALFGALTLTTTAGAEQPAADPLCSTMHAVQGSALDVGGGVARWTVTARPGCEGATVTLAGHRTAYMAWNEDEDQPLAASASAVLSDTPVVVVLELPELPAPGPCRWQLDGVAGDALQMVDSEHRYNEFSIGGSRNRLVVARYVDGVCAVEAPPTTQPEALPPAEVPPSSSTVPGPDGGASLIHVEWSTPAPAVEVGPPAGPVRSLPETGGRAVATAVVGAVLFLVGSVAVFARRVLRDLPPGRGWDGLLEDVARVG